jgi:hypothetical protein
MDELGAARTILRQSEVMQLVRDRDSERYLRLEGLLSRSVFDPKTVLLSVYRFDYSHLFLFEVV